MIEVTLVDYISIHSLVSTFLLNVVQVGWKKIPYDVKYKASQGLKIQPHLNVLILNSFRNNFLYAKSSFFFNIVLCITDYCKPRYFFPLINSMQLFSTMGELTRPISTLEVLFGWGIGGIPPMELVLFGKQMKIHANVDISSLCFCLWCKESRILGSILIPLNALAYCVLPFSRN